MVKDATSSTKDQTPTKISKEGAQEGGPKLDFLHTPTASRSTWGVGVKSDIKFEVGLPFFVLGAVLGCVCMFGAMTFMVPPPEACGVQTTTCHANHAHAQRSLSELQQKFSTITATNKVCEEAKGRLETRIKSLEVSECKKTPTGAENTGVKALEEKVKALTAENAEVKAYNTKISEEHKKAANFKKAAELEAQKCGEKHKAMIVELNTIRKGQETMQSDNAASGVAPAILAQSASELLTKCAGGIGPNCPPKEAIYTISWGMTNLRAALADNPAKDPAWLDYIDRVLGDCGNVLKMLEAGQNLDQGNFKIIYTNSKDLFNYLSPIANKAMKPHQKTASLMGEFCKNHQCLGV